MANHFVQNIKPNTASGGNGTTGGTRVAVLSDSDSGTYVFLDTSDGIDDNLLMGFSVTLPVGAKVYRRLLSVTAYNNGYSTPFTLTVDGVNDAETASTTPAGKTVDNLNETTVPGGGVLDVDGNVFKSGSGSPSGQLYIATASLRVEYNTAPAAPTLTAPAGTIRIATPTFQGNYNDADGDGGKVQIELRRNDNSNLIWTSAWLNDNAPSFDQVYTGPALVSGTTYKWRARQDDGTGAANAIGPYSGYTTFTYLQNTAPTATIPSPAAGSQVGSLTPNITVNFSDPENDTFAAYQIQVRRQSDSVSFWDTGILATTSGQQTARQVVKTYAGTVLVNGTVYEVRARVQDLPGLWSDYSAWQAFTPALVPDAPTITSPLGLINTLTPTIQGSYNRATGNTEKGFQYHIQQNGVDVYQSGDVTGAIATGQAYGTNNSADTPASPPALQWGTAYTIRVRSKDNSDVYGPWTDWLAFHTNAAPLSPTNLSPSGNAITGDQTPTMTWQHNDPDGDAQTAVEIELYDITAAAYVTGYDPKALTQSTLTHDETQTLTLNHAYQWRIRTKGLAGPGFSPWSSYAFFTVSTVPTVSVTAPTPGQTLGTPSLTVEWTVSGGSGTQDSYRVKVFADDQVTVKYDSGTIAGTSLSLVIPSGTWHDNETDYVQVTSTDTLAQVGVSSMIQVLTDWTPPATITGLVATALGDQR